MTAACDCNDRRWSIQISRLLIVALVGTWRSKAEWDILPSPFEVGVCRDAVNDFQLGCGVSQIEELDSVQLLSESFLPGAYSFVEGRGTLSHDLVVDVGCGLGHSVLFVRCHDCVFIYDEQDG